MLEKMKAQKAIGQFAAIRRQVRSLPVPPLSRDAPRRSPYQILVSCILSLRTQDRTTEAAARRLFARARTPRQMLRLPQRRLEKLIYPVGFYRVKAGVIRRISRRLVEEFRGRLPRTREGLMSFKGVGLKTANLVLSLGFGIPAICVDTHVHRISNRIGWVRTETPDETERSLRMVFPRTSWIGLNTALVSFGQNICQPVSPWCSRCALRASCSRRGVARSR